MFMLTVNLCINVYIDSEHALQQQQAEAVSQEVKGPNLLELENAKLELDDFNCDLNIVIDEDG